MEASPRRGSVALGLGAIYLIWGSTYLGIAIAVDEIPPLMMAFLRFVPAGALLYAWSRWRGAPPASPRAWAWSAAIGFLLLTLGNGFLSIAETRMPSGVAALVVATVPLWLVTLQAALERRAPSPRVLAALGLGLAGVAYLAGEDAGWEGGHEPRYVALVVCGSFAWAAGSLLSRRLALPVPATQATAMQMIGGGTLLLLASVATGEAAGWDPAATAERGWWAVLYLSAVGSLVALTTYNWLIRTAPPALVGTYAFVNPVVAVAVGAALAQEPLTARLGLSGALIVAAVALIVWDNARLPAPAPPRASPADAGAAPAADAK